MFHRLVLRMKKRVIHKITTETLLPDIFYFAVNGAANQIILEDRCQRSIRRWWRSRLPLRFLILFRLRVDATRAIECVYHRIVIRRIWHSAMVELKIKTKAAIKLQTLFRKMYVRLKFLSILRRNARREGALKIQRCVHRFLAYKIARKKRQLDSVRETNWNQTIRDNDKFEFDIWSSHRAILNFIMHGSLCTSSRKFKISKRVEMEHNKNYKNKCNEILNQRKLNNDPTTPKKKKSMETSNSNPLTKQKRSPPMFKPLSTIKSLVKSPSKNFNDVRTRDSFSSSPL